MSLANVKRRMRIGQKIQMVYHDFSPLPEHKPNEKVAGIRRVVRVQTNGVNLEGGSWLHWPVASQIRETATGFEVALEPDFSKLMRYEWRD